MTQKRASLDAIEEFLAQRRIALVGLSRDPKHFSVYLCEELCRRGYDVVPVNPNAKVVQGKRCFARVRDIDPPVDAVLLMTAAKDTEAAVRDCVEAGVRRVWMHRSGGQGAVDPASVELCRERGIAVIPGECPFMFLPNTGVPHRVHGLLRKITGRFPHRLQA